MENGNSVLLGIAAPQIHMHLPIDTLQVRTYIERVEVLGFHSLWVQEQSGIKLRTSTMEGVSMLSYAAALTRQVPTKARCGSCWC